MSKGSGMPEVAMEEDAVALMLVMLLKGVDEYERKRFQTPERKKKSLEYQSKRRKLYKGKDQARGKVNNAIRDGRLVKLPCEICGDPKAEAHHDDYRKKLKVRWLCFKHHREYHQSKN